MICYYDISRVYLPIIKDILTDCPCGQFYGSKRKKLKYYQKKKK